MFNALFGLKHSARISSFCSPWIIVCGGGRAGSSEMSTHAKIVMPALFNSNAAANSLTYRVTFAVMEITSYIKSRYANL